MIAVRIRTFIVLQLYIILSEMNGIRVAFFYPLPLGLQQPQAVPWAQEYVVYMYGSDAANCTGYKLNGHC